MPTFKDWYEAKYGPYPGETGEAMHIVMARLADAFAKFVDEAIAVRLPDRGCATAFDISPIL